MPELPEVETVRIGLERLLPGKVIIAEKHDWPKGFPNSDADVKEFLIGAQIQRVDRRGKALIIELNTGYSLLIHLKMTGQLVYVPAEQKDPGSQSLDLRGATKVRQSKVKDPRSKISNVKDVRFGAGHPNESLIAKLPDKSTRVTLSFKDGSHLYFNDQRKFGWVKLLPIHAVHDEDFIKKLGPEPLEDDFTNTIFIQQIRRRANTSVKAALLDQTVLAGVGNIYADEALWGAKIHPATLVKNVPDAKLKKLHQELIDVLKLSIEKGGSTDKNYVNAEGKKGSYVSFARVFRRENQPCPRCKTTIEKTRVAGRGTHVCPVCQPQPK